MRKLKISVKELYKSFKKKVVLKNLNLDIYESESLAIIGESGSGKSILTRCVTGLVEYETGKILFENLGNVKEFNFNDKMKYMSNFGILFQNSALLDSLTIFENLRFAKEEKNFNKILDEVGLPKSISRLQISLDIKLSATQPNSIPSCVFSLSNSLLHFTPH